MFKKVFFFLLLSIIAFFNSNFVFASEIDNLEQNIDNLEQYLTLKNKVSENVIKSIPKIFYENWESYLIASSGKDSDALIVITMLSIQKTIKFLAVDYPLDFAYNIGKEMFSLARIILTTDISGLIGKIEQITVDKAIEYAMNELFKHEIRVGSGIMETDYITNKGTKSNVKINYIITQKQINNESQNKKYETVIRLYSPKTIEVPTNKFLGNFMMVYENQDEIKPFTVTMKGEMEYKNFNYRWMDTPEIIVEYPKVVPDFGFKPVSFWEKYVTKPIGETLKSIKKLFNLGGGSIFDSFSSHDLEIIEENEDLEELAEEIREIEDELEQENEKIEQTEEEFAEKVAQLNKENELSESETVPDQLESNENLITLKDDMTEEEVRQLLIAIYNELLKRQTALASQEQENNNDENDEKQEELELEKDKKEKSPKKEISYCVYNNQTPLSNKLIINEVAWMGTSNNSADEWIELKNISSEVIDLEGYQLLDKDNQIQVIFKDLKVNPGDYVLLERTDDNTVPNIKADIIYKGNLNNNKESLYLFNNNCVLEDMVLADPNWPAGDSSNKKSMERKLDLTWQTYSGDSFGTPKAPNSEGGSVVVPGGGGGGGSNPPKEEIKYCAQTNLSSPTRNSVIINEVAWMGISKATDEWIELKNITSNDISLKDYQLLDKENQIKVVFKEEDVILANSFYLLERTDNNTVPNIKADKIYTGALSDTNESLRLFNSNCELMDEVLADPNWPAGDSSNKKSMERKLDLTWQTYSGDSFGTPKAPNSEGGSVVVPGGGGGGGSNPPKEEIKYCAQTNLSSPTRNSVIINEVAWMGVSKATDEWIELKNITSKDISLKGYQLLDKENQIKVVFKEEDVILANSFYLLERTNDETVPNIKADKIYTGALSDTNESLRLFNSNCELMDEVLADPNWPAGDNSNKKSMERKLDLTWQTYSKDSFGTPRAENSITNAYVPNPASVFCDEKGGKIEIRQNGNGDQYGVCVFDDGKMCEEWAMYSDSCRIGGIDTSYFTDEEDLFCAIRGGRVGDSDCYLPSGKTCDLASFYKGSCIDKTYANSLIITEVSEGYNNDDREYVRLFNQSGKDISLCSSENNCFYLAYFSPEGNDYQPPEWNKPNLNIPLENVLLNNNSYYQIDFTKDNRGNFKPLNDGDHLFMNNGSVCIFNQDVTKLSSEDEAKKAKIDCVGWLYYGNLSYGPEYDINEYAAVSRLDAIDRRTEQNRYALLRKKDSLNDLYFDRDNNPLDFEYGKPTIYTLTSVLNFKFTELEDKTNLRLSWDFSDFLDLTKISYKVIYTKNNDFNSKENIIEMAEKKAASKHVEEIIPSIEEGIDYRFRVKIFEEGGNESDQLDHLFYVYISSFDNHIYGLKRYDYNKTNHTSYLGPQNGVVKKDLISQGDSWLFLKAPLIDKYGNFYFVGGINDLKVVSYDKNGLFRWETNTRNNSSGDIIFNDTPYYFSQNKLIKFSHTGDILWESYFDQAIGYENALFYNNHLYFDCILLEKRGLCSRNLEKDGQIELLYETDKDKDLSNLLVDELGNIFFVANNAKLIKMTKEGFKELDIYAEKDWEYSKNLKILMVDNKILVYSYLKTFLIDKSGEMSMLQKHEKDWEEKSPTALAFTVKDNLYIIECYTGVDGTLYSINLSNFEKTMVMDKIEIPENSNYSPIVDANDNIYYMGLDNSHIIGYKKDGDTFLKILDEDAGRYLFSEMVLVNGKIYYPAREKFVEFSFE
ncbi:MAG: lamin tail domain-containing protein [Minisyncoccales bacterium]